MDYHFSDYWADPQKQAQPVAWPNTLPPLASTLRSYVSNTLQIFHKAGVDLALVSLGNEIRHGMIWPLGRVSVDVEPESARIANFTGLATLYNAARKGVDDAVRAGVAKPQVMIHIDNGYDLRLQQRWFSALTATGKVKTSDWDVFGFSLYPFYGTGATLKNLKTTVNWIAKKYGKPIHVVETDWPAICTGEGIPTLSEPSIPASVNGQLEWVGKVIDVVKQYVLFAILFISVDVTDYFVGFPMVLDRVSITGSRHGSTIPALAVHARTPSCLMLIGASFRR